MGSITERPWGTYDILYDGADCKVKRIVVNPGHRLSLQSHTKRDEDWLIISGEGEIEIITKNSQERWVTYPGEHVAVARGYKHRISNLTGTEPVVLIEIQTGSYFGEDDIIRYEDDYGRVDNGPKS